MRRHGLALALSILALTGATRATAQTTGTISGVLTDATTGAPLVTQQGTVTYWVVAYSGTDPIGRIAPTDSAGRYSFTALPPASYYLKASGSRQADLGNSSEYIRELHNDIPCVAADCDPTTGTPVVVTGGSTTIVDFGLQVGGTISGTVRRGDGQNISTTFVSLYNASTSLVETTVASVTGTYAFHGLPAGTYYALTRTFPGGLVDRANVIDQLYSGIPCVSRESFPCRIAQGTPIAVSAGAITTVDFTLPATGRIRGRISSQSDGLPIGGIGVAAFVGGTQVASTATFASGDYVLEMLSLPPGSYAVRTTFAATRNYVDEWYSDSCVVCGGRPTLVPVAASTTTENIDFVLAPGGGISGTVSYDAGAVPPPLTIPEIIQPLVHLYNAIGTPVAFIPSASGGRFSFSGLPTGTYYLRTSNLALASGVQRAARLVDEIYDNVACVAEDCDPTRGTPVRVTAGTVTAGIDFSLDRAGRISGRLPAGRPTVEIYDARGVRLPGRAFTNDLGQPPGFVAGGLPAGVYYLKMVPSPAGREPETLYRNQLCAGCSITSGTPVPVTLGVEVTGIDFAAAPSTPSRQISGTVRDAATSAPLSAITVEIYSSSGVRVATDDTNSAGGFAVPGLAPGTYFARTRNTRGYADRLYPDVACADCGVTLGAPIVVTAADISGVDFTLPAAAVVSGIVTAEGIPLSATVSIFDQAGSVVARSQANALGQFRAALLPGSYRARTDPVAGYGQELYRERPCPRGICDPLSGTPIPVATTAVSGIDFTLNACSAITISPRRLATAAVGTAYRQTVSAAGAVAPLRFDISAGSLPQGLALDAATGVLSGAPTAAGRHTFTVSAADQTGCVGTREYTLDVPACAFIVTGGPTSHRAGGGPALIEVAEACGAWTATTTDAWLQIDSIRGTTNFAVLVHPNPLATPRTGTIIVGPRVFTIAQSGLGAPPPFGLLETPAEGAQVSGSIAVSGWALDELGVFRVQIFRDPVAGEPASQVFIGQATFVAGARPDVERTFPGVPNNRRAGWGYLLLTNMLPNNGNGTFKLYAYADNADLNRTLLGTRTIVVANSTATLPFGAIDTPDQGATVSGNAYVNFGWALTPQPQTIPTNGSTIQVIIDGVPLGTVTYNLFRADVSGLFPSLNNTAGPVGYRTLDTTALDDGMHTIAWVATDDGGRAQGIGSRFFTVNNSAWSSVSGGLSSLAAESAPVISRGAGVDLDRRAASLDDLPLAAEGPRSLRIAQLERVELDLAGEVSACAPTYAGYSIAGGETRELPIGSSLDGAAGVFYWQPGPGFIGRYDLLFVRTACDGSRERLPVRITIAK